MPIMNAVCRKTGGISFIAYERESRSGKSILTVGSRRWLRTKTRVCLMFHSFRIANLESEQIKLKIKNQ